MEKYQNKYRVASARAEWWNYAWSGAYFITICTHNRRHFLGAVQNGTMRLSHAGILADVLWHQIPYHAKNVELGAFVVMPNHVHGILILNDPPELGVADRDMGEPTPGGAAGTTGTTGTPGTTTVETGHALSLQALSPHPADPIRPDDPNKLPPLTEILIQEMENRPKSPLAQARFQNQGKNTVSSIIGSYKSAVTRNARRLNLEFEWQTRFYDNIIRSDGDYQRINDYIEANPQNWKEDKFFTP